MKWVLIALHLSSWDSAIADRLEIGVYPSKSECEVARREIVTARSYMTHSDDFLCSEQRQGGKP
jgi:hypothetical protein